MTVSLELDAFPAVQRMAGFPTDHTSQQVSNPRKGRVPREEPGTWGQNGVPATVPHQGERGWVVGSYAHGLVILWGIRRVLRLGG